MDRSPLIAVAAVMVAFAVPAGISAFVDDGGKASGPRVASPSPSPEDSINVRFTIATPTPRKPSDQPSAARDLLRRTNLERTRRGLTALVWWQPGVAETHAQTRRMLKAGRLSHNPGLDELMVRYKARALGENVGISDSIGHMQDAFMKSPEHRDNILTPEYRGFSAWVIKDSRGLYWATINFVLV